MLGAARRLFVEQGVDGTTVAAVAEAAGVSTQTVYAAFSSKAGLLVGLLGEMERAADGADLAAAIKASSSPREQIRLIAHFHVALFERGGDLLQIVLGASGDPDVRRFVDEGEARRRRACRSWVRTWSEQGVLRSTLDRRSATDLLWVHCGPELYLAFVKGCGWSPHRVECWLEDTLAGLLLVPDEEGDPGAA